MPPVAQITTLEALRRRREWSQEQMAAHLGISQVMYSYLESRKVREDRVQHHLTKLADLLGIAVDEVLMPYEQFILRHPEQAEPPA